MTTHDALLAAVLANPQDDVVRAAYADHCRENGQEELADFIEVQLELAKLPTEPKKGAEVGSADWHVLGMHESTILPPRQSCRWCDLRRSECRLWQTVDKKRFAPWHDDLIVFSSHASAVAKFRLDERGSQVVVRRGFVAEVRCSLADWYGIGPDVVNSCPVDRVVMTDRWSSPVLTSSGRPSWNWYTGTTENSPYLPVDVFLLMGGVDYEPLEFATFGDAEAAASGALIAWAKGAPDAAARAALISCGRTMRVLKYPRNSMLYKTCFHAGGFRLVTVSGASSRDFFITLLGGDVDSSHSLSGKLMSVNGLPFHSRFVTDAAGERLLLLGDDHALFDLMTGQLVDSLDYTLLPHYSVAVHVGWDDHWVVMNASIARTQGHLIMGPSVFADGVHLPRSGESDDDHIVVYRRGGSARTLRLPVPIPAPRIFLAPDGLTVLVAGLHHHAVIVDLE